VILCQPTWHQCRHLHRLAYHNPGPNWLCQSAKNFPLINGFNLNIFSKKCTRVGSFCENLFGLGQNFLLKLLCPWEKKFLYSFTIDPCLKSFLPYFVECFQNCRGMVAFCMYCQQPSKIKKNILKYYYFWKNIFSSIQMATWTSSSIWVWMGCSWPKMKLKVFQLIDNSAGGQKNQTYQASLQQEVPHCLLGKHHDHLLPNLDNTKGSAYRFQKKVISLNDYQHISFHLELSKL